MISAHITPPKPIERIVTINMTESEARLLRTIIEYYPDSTPPFGWSAEKRVLKTALWEQLGVAHT